MIAVQLALLAGLLPGSAAPAPPSQQRRFQEAPTVAVDAGPDLEVELGERARLAGTVSGLAPIHFWAGDGNQETENRMLIYHSDTGLDAFGPLVLEGNRTVIFGWPSDVVRIDGVVYGIETGKKRFYRLDERTAECTPIGRTLPYEWLTCMAYDAQKRRLFAIDGKLDQLMLIDVAKGTTRHVGPRLPYDEVKGMAYLERSGRIFAYDQKTNELFTIDPSTAQTQPYLTLRLPPKAFFDELDEHDGELYGVLAWFDEDDVRMGQVQHIDLTTGARTDVGPAMVDVSAHSLMIESMPQRVKWSMLRGPGRARFESPGKASTDVEFTEPGLYVLRLSVSGSAGVGDVVEVRVRPRDCNRNGVDDRREIELDPSADANRNGRLDECECLPPPRVLCSFEPARGRRRPELDAAGDPEPLDEAFRVLIEDGFPFQTGLLFFDIEPRSRPVLLPYRSLTRPLGWIHLGRLDAWGSASIQIDVEPWLAGTTGHFRFLNVADAGSSRAGIRMADILQVSFCL